MSVWFDWVQPGNCSAPRGVRHSQGDGGSSGWKVHGPLPDLTAWDVYPPSIQGFPLWSLHSAWAFHSTVARYQDRSLSGKAKPKPSCRAVLKTARWVFFFSTSFKANLGLREGETVSVSQCGVAKTWGPSSNSSSCSHSWFTAITMWTVGIMPGTRCSVPTCWFMAPSPTQKEPLSSSPLTTECPVGTGSIERPQPGCTEQM